MSTLGHCHYLRSDIVYEFDIIITDTIKFLYEYYINNVGIY